MDNNLNLINKIKELIDTGEAFEAFLRYEYDKENFTKLFIGDEIDLEFELGGKVNNFYRDYQNRYSESILILKHVLSDRLDDFKKFYEIPLNRNNLDLSSYKIEDFLNRNEYLLNNGYLLGGHTIITKVAQQTSILRGLENVSENILFNIDKILQKDLYRSELDSAEDLNKKGFVRCAGVIAGVVLENYLKNICKSKGIEIKFDKPTITNYSEAIYKFDSSIIDKIQHQKNITLSLIRNKCGHIKEEEPTNEEVQELIDLVGKIINNPSNFK